MHDTSNSLQNTCDTHTHLSAIGFSIIVFVVLSGDCFHIMFAIFAFTII